MRPAGLPVAAADAVLALPAAVLLSVGVWGRTTPRGAPWFWVLTCAAAWCAIFGWYAWSRRRAAGDAPGPPRGLGPLPAAALSTAVLAVLYASDTAYHAWVYLPGSKALALSAGVLLVWYGGTFHPPLHLTLGATGLLHALSFSQVATDDLIRYWGIADGLRQGAGYSVTAGVPGSGEFYLVDLPLYPLTLLLSFGTLGHRYAAAHAPLVLANIALPFLFYWLARAAGAGRLSSVATALLVVALPPYQVYTLSAAQPDPLWAALLAALLALALAAARATHGTPVVRSRGAYLWVSLGLLSAAVVLTRPEGAIYAGLVLAGLAWAARRGPRGVLVAALVAAIPVVAFAAALYTQFGIWWAASGWTNVAGPHYVLPNLQIVVRQNLPYYAAVLGLPTPAIAGVVLAGALGIAGAVGYARLWHRHPPLRIVPAAVLANVLVILMSPTHLGADRLGPATFFRHASVCVPALVPLLALSAPGPETTASRWRDAIRWSAALLAAAALAGELAVLGTTAARTAAGRLTALTSDPYVLVPDMLQMADALPVLPFHPGPGRGTEIDPAFDYLGFRSRLFAAARSYDLHVNDTGRSFTLAATVFGVTGLLALARAKQAGD